jgi:Fe-S cluster assembly protein SufD
MTPGAAQVAWRLPRNKQLIDYHTNVSCVRTLYFRGIIGDSAGAVFNGRIHIHPQAQRPWPSSATEPADLTQRRVYTKPELGSTPTTCAHGARCTQLDPDLAVFFTCRAAGCPMQRP